MPFDIHKIIYPMCIDDCTKEVTWIIKHTSRYYIFQPITPGTPF